jgi:type VI secretion system secreted protein VgrG
MPQPTQATRHIAIETPLGEDVLLLQSFSGHEELSRLFAFDLDLLSENYEIDFEEIIGQNVTIRMDLPEGEPRYWNGFISRFVQGASNNVQFAQYRATMVPWLWFLTQTSDCRIFQEKTVPEIIRQVFSDHDFTDIEDRLSGGYRTWNYCVQYRETDYNFVSRLMEQEGIYYYFFHEQGKCTLVLCDSLSRHDPYENYESIDFTTDIRGSDASERITEWTVEKKIRSGKFAHIDYNFEKPSTSLMSIEEDRKSHIRSNYEIYDFPGEYSEKTEGDRYARLRMEELSHSYEICTGQSDARGICTGYRFALNRHTRRDQNREYLIVSTSYQAAAQSYETSGGSNRQCSCFFSVIPASVQFRPERITPKPLTQGSQTAVVVGPPGEEIYTDEHARVKVQFHWDRESSRNQNSSCWIRVSQGWAGAGWGTIHIPRIGHEVIVDFIEGDPDRPIITGRLYNADKVTPYELPNHKNISTIKSRSTPNDSGSNELRFNDTAGAEQIYLHAQGCRDTIVNGSWRETVGNEKHETIKSNKFEKVDGNVERQVVGYCNNFVGGIYQLRAVDDLSLISQGNMEHYCRSNQFIGADGELVIKGMRGICIKFDSSNFITIDSGGVTIQGNIIKLNSGGRDLRYTGLEIFGETEATKATSGLPFEESERRSGRPVQASRESRSMDSDMLSSATQAGGTNRSFELGEAEEIDLSEQDNQTLELGEAERIDIADQNNQTLELGEAERIDTADQNNQTLELGEAERIDPSDQNSEDSSSSNGP